MKWNLNYFVYLHIIPFLKAELKLQEVNPLKQNKISNKYQSTTFSKLKMRGYYYQ
jgi:hypothetical protein